MMMNVLPVDSPSAGLLASNPLLESISEALNAGPQATESVLFLTGAIALVLLVFLAARFFARPPGDEAESRVDYLTLAVDVLGLSESDRRDLRRLARRAHLKRPAAMLLSPANLARAAAVTREIEDGDELRRRIEQLCVRLFDTPLPDPEQPPEGAA
jgi:hypothetical protein